MLGIADVWNSRKGLSDFIKLREKLDDHYLIVLVGVTKDIQKTLPKGVLGIQRTQNQQELALIYAVADVFINLTYEDTYPTTNLEAMACGTPVVTYRTGGSPETITSETGWIVEKGNVEEIANLLVTIDYDNLLDKVRACRERASMYFDQYRCFECYANMYY